MGSENAIGLENTFDLKGIVGCRRILLACPKVCQHKDSTAGIKAQTRIRSERLGVLYLSRPLPLRIC